MHSSALAKFSGQNRRRLGKAAGQRSAATRVAAAFAASLAILVCSVGSALVAPPAIQVEVSNSATKPALISSVDDPGRIAFESKVDGQVQDTWSEFEFFH